MDGRSFQIAGFQPSMGRNATLVSELNTGTPIIEDDHSDEVLENRRWFRNEAQRIFRRTEKRIDAMFEDHLADTKSLLNRISDILAVHLPRSGCRSVSDLRSDLTSSSPLILHDDFRSDLFLPSSLRPPNFRSGYQPSSTFRHHQKSFAAAQVYVGVPSSWAISDVVLDDLTTDEGGEENEEGDDIALDDLNQEGDEDGADADIMDEENEGDGEVLALEKEVDIDDSEKALMGEDAVIDSVMTETSPLQVEAQPVLLQDSSPSHYYSVDLLIDHTANERDVVISMANNINIIMAGTLELPLVTKLRSGMYQICIKFGRKFVTPQVFDKMSRGSLIRNWKKRKKKPWILLHCRKTELEDKFSFQGGSIVTFPIGTDRSTASSMAVRQLESSSSSSIPINRRECFSFLFS